MLFVNVFREGFLKKIIWSRPTFTGEILYLFCTCIINWDVFNYFGCWNKACEVVYSVAEFSLSCFVTVVKLQSGVGDESVSEFLSVNSSDAEPRLRPQLFHCSCTEPHSDQAAVKTRTAESPLLLFHQVLQKFWFKLVKLQHQTFGIGNFWF